MWPLTFGGTLSLPLESHVKDTSISIVDRIQFSILSIVTSNFALIDRVNLEDFKFNE